MQRVYFREMNVRQLAHLSVSESSFLTNSAVTPALIHKIGTLPSRNTFNKKNSNIYIIHLLYDSKYNRKNTFGSFIYDL